MGKPAIFSMTTFPFPMEEPAGEGLCSAVKEVLDILTASTFSQIAAQYSSLQSLALFTQRLWIIGKGNVL